VWDRWATNLDQASPRAEGQGVKQLNANLFSGPAFALDQYRDVGFGYFFYFVSNGLQGRSLTEENIHRRQTKGRSGFTIMNQVVFPSLLGIKAKVQHISLCTLRSNPSGVWEFL
jgi:hypothetical protein